MYMVVKWVQQRSINISCMVLHMHLCYFVQTKCMVLHMHSIICAYKFIKYAYKFKYPNLFIFDANQAQLLLIENRSQ